MKPVIAILLCGAATPAWALSTPSASPKDAHVRIETYDPQNRTPLVLQQGMVTNITFDVMERIKRVVMGDENGPVSSINPKDDNQNPLLNNLPLFGKAIGRSDMVVITQAPDGMERPYLFALRVVTTPKDGSDDPEATYSLSFTYPVQQKAAAQQAAQASWKERQATKVKEAAEARLNTDVFYGQQNWRYVAMSRFKAIAPIEAHDNGRLTAFRYPGNMEHPAVFKVMDGDVQSTVCAGEKPSRNDLRAAEQAVPITVYDDMIVVQQTAAHFRLRSADQVADIWNCAWDPVGANPGTGTTSPDVRRVVTTK